MRLAGIGMVGVIHANSVQEALQRFSDRVDFSHPPAGGQHHRVLVKEGVDHEIYDVGFTIKVPEGMARRDAPPARDHGHRLRDRQLVLEIFRVRMARPS